MLSGRLSLVVSAWKCFILFKGQNVCGTGCLLFARWCVTCMRRENNFGAPINRESGTNVKSKALPLLQRVYSLSITMECPRNPDRESWCVIAELPQLRGELHKLSVFLSDLTQIWAKRIPRLLVGSVLTPLTRIEATHRYPCKSATVSFRPTNSDSDLPYCSPVVSRWAVLIEWLVLSSSFRALTVEIPNVIYTLL